MLGISLEESRVYQDAKVEGRVKGREEGCVEGRVEGRVEGIVLGERKLVIRQLNRKLGKIPQAVLTKIIASSACVLSHPPFIIIHHNKFICNAIKCRLQFLDLSGLLSPSPKSSVIILERSGTLYMATMQN